jgi:hypothetical protein
MWMLGSQEAFRKCDNQRIATGSVTNRGSQKSVANAEKGPSHVTGSRFGNKAQSNNRLAGMTAAEKLKVEKDEERAHRHLSRRRRRHSIAVSDIQKR